MMQNIKLKKILEKKELFWKSSLHFVGGLPYIIVFIISLIFYNRMGKSNSIITISTSLFFIPLIIRPILGNIVTNLMTKRFWLLSMELILSISMLFESLIIKNKEWFTLSLFIFFIATTATVVHDIAVSRFHKDNSPHKITLAFNGYTLFIFLSVVFAFGIGLMYVGNLEVLLRNVKYSWVHLFRFFSIIFFLFFLYHLFILPHYNKNISSNITQLSNLTITRRWINETKSIISNISKNLPTLFILFFLLIPQGMFFRIALLFFIDSGSNGGLGLSPQEVALSQGTLGAFAMLYGSLIGMNKIKKNGITHSLWTMVLAITLPKLLYIYLSYKLSLTFPVINLFVIIEQLGLGYGIIAYIYLLFSLSVGTNPTFRFSIGIAIAALSLMLSGVFTGFLQEYLGYRHFFVIVSIISCLPIIATGYIKKKKLL